MDRAEDVRGEVHFSAKSGRTGLERCVQKGIKDLKGLPVLIKQVDERLRLVVVRGVIYKAHL